MILTEDDATKVLNSILDILRDSAATEVLDGIDESRRLGMEEVLPEKKGAEMKQVARTRRRPARDVEMVAIVLERLYQRLIVVPSLGTVIKKRFGIEDVHWQVDREFVSVDRFPEARLSELLPDGADKVREGFAEILRLIPSKITEDQGVKHGN